MTNLINQPPNTAIDDGKVINMAWGSFFNSIFVILTALTQSGVTANRPVKLLWVGRVYFDTTLGLPIWYKGPGWVKADGTPA